MGGRRREVTLGVWLLLCKLTSTGQCESGSGSDQAAR